MKYIIKNCPCYSTTFNMCSLEMIDETYCQDCTDCLLKQIVGLLKEYDKENSEWCEPLSFNTENIYDLLDIQEVEE